MRGKPILWGGLLIGLAVGSAGLQFSRPDDGWAVRASPWLRTTPKILDPGLHFLLPGLFRMYHYPVSPVQLEIDLGGPKDPHAPPLSPEGSELRVRGNLKFEIDPSRLGRLHREAGADYSGNFLEPLVRTHLLEILGSQPLQNPGATPEGVARRLQTRLETPLRELGILLKSVRIASVEPFSADVAGQGTVFRDPSRAGSRVLLVGWDGADWNLIDPLLASGRMPNLARLIDHGSRARLKTINPVLSPVVWTSIATGVRPERHGIVDFVATDSLTGEQVPVTSNLRKVAAIWNLVSDAGLRVGIVGWWATWPPEPVTGYIISDRVATNFTIITGSSNVINEGKVYPSDLWPSVEGRIVSADQIAVADLQFFLDPARFESLAGGMGKKELLEGLKAYLASTRSYQGIATQMAGDDPADLEAVYFQGIDRISHLFMPYRPPRLDWISSKEVEVLGLVVDRFYEYQDTLLGEFLQRIGPETTVVVCSDHGFRSDRNRPRTDPRIGHGRAADWHRKYGILVIRGEPIRPGQELLEASVLDLVPTVLTLLGLPIPPDLDGRVLVEAFRPEFLEEHPVRYRSYPHHLLAADTRPLQSPEDEAIRQNLVSLGYLSQDNLSARNNLGILHLSHGRWEEAIEEFQKALEVNSDFLPARVNLGRAYLRQGDRDRAREELRRVIIANPRSKEAWDLLGNIAMGEGDLEVAEKYFLRGVAIDPNDTDIRNSLGLLYDRMGRWQEAVEQYRTVIEVDPDFEKGYNNLGILYQQRGRLEEARELFQRAVEADADFLGSYNNLGIVLQDLGDLPAAEEVFLRGLRRHPTHPVLLNSLGGVYYRRGALQEARQKFELALEIDPEYESAHNNLGAVLGKLGDRSGQIEQYRRAIEIRGDYTDARYNLALAYLEQGLMDKGFRELQELLRIDPGHLAALLTLANHRMAMGDLPEAETLLLQACDRHPEQPVPRNLLGRIYVRQGREGDARRSFEESLRLDSDQPRIQEELQSLPEAFRKPFAGDTEEGSRQ